MFGKECCTWFLAFVWAVYGFMVLIWDPRRVDATIASVVIMAV